MTTLEDAPAPGPFPRGAKYGMLVGGFIAIPGTILLASRLIDTPESPLSHTEQWVYSGDIALGGVVVLLSFLAGIINTRQGR